MSTTQYNFQEDDLPLKKGDPPLAEKLARLHLLINEANVVRDKDKNIIRSLLSNFYGKTLRVGIGFNRAYGSILSGDYFFLGKLPDGNYVFIIADVSGHGLPAYTTLVRFRSAISLATREVEKQFRASGKLDTAELILRITQNFTYIMQENELDDFICALFTFIYNDGDKFYLKFYNRSMLFPMIVRKFRNTPLDIYNLNIEEKGWFPQRGYLLGSALHDLLGDEYYHTPSCDFTIYEGDRVLFYSDGLVEAANKLNIKEEYGFDRIKNLLIENINHTPQETVNLLFQSIYSFIGTEKNQKDDMTAILIDFPLVR